MNILYCHWGENTAEDCINSMISLGHGVRKITASTAAFSSDEGLREQVVKILRSATPSFSCVFSFNYLPMVSDAAEAVGIPYISWVYDSPHLTLYSKNITNSCNRIYVFDYGLCQFFEGKGIHTLQYMPLPVNTNRLQNLTGALPAGYLHEISFIGNLYNDEYNFLDQIEGLPDELRGYIDGIIRAQLQLYGADVIEDCFTDAHCDCLGQYASLQMGPRFMPCRNDIFRDMIRKKATVIERPYVLELLGSRFSLAHYCGTPSENLPVTFMGYAENYTQMPSVFHRSKINLNVTLRSIRTGIPLRVIEILGAGGFCLSNYQAELPEYFTNGENICWYESYEDLLGKCAYYLDPSHEEERLRIARKGFETAKDVFSYEVLLPKVLHV